MCLRPGLLPCALGRARSCGGSGMRMVNTGGENANGQMENPDEEESGMILRGGGSGLGEIEPFFRSQEEDGSFPPYPSTASSLALNPRIQDIELNDELKASFMSYAMSTILGRALPDARDGLKPVHRRVLYAMHCLNLTPESTYRKCARVVGEVLGKFHPHGDMSVYDALVRMAQDFVMLHPLVAGHGNFGSVDNDPAAAMRYTEAKLSKLAFDSLLADIKEETVEFCTQL